MLSHQRIGRRVIDHIEPLRLDAVRGLHARELLQIGAVPGLEPDAVLLGDSDERDRRRQCPCREGGDAVEGALGGHLQDVVAAHGIQALLLVDRLERGVGLVPCAGGDDRLSESDREFGDQRAVCGVAREHPVQDLAQASGRSSGMTGS